MADSKFTDDGFRATGDLRTVEGLLAYLNVTDEPVDTQRRAIHRLIVDQPAFQGTVEKLRDQLVAQDLWST